MDTNKIVAKLGEMIDQYNVTSNRMVLTIIKQMVTKLVKQNGFTMYRIERMFETHNTTLSILHN